MARSFNLDFCEEFGYPDQVRDHFSRIIKILNLDKTRSVLLVGSASRGELTYAFHNGRISVISDYEFFVIANNLQGRSEGRRLRPLYRQLENEIRRNDLFHIDFSCVTEKRLSRFPHTVFVHETRASGKTIYGENLRDRIPEVTPDNLNRKELNEILIWRLWAMLLYLPADVLMGASGVREAQYNYVLCKNALDLTTWVLPWEEYLFPTFRERVQFIANNYAKLKCSQFMGAAFPNFLTECLAGKLDLDFRQLPGERYLQTVSYYSRALELMLDYSSIDVKSGDTLTLVQENSSSLFRDVTLKRKGYELLLLAQNLTHVHEKNWFFLEKHGLILSLLFLMHQGVCAHVQDRLKDAQHHLKSAIRILRKLTFDQSEINNIDLGCYPSAWNGVRRVLANFMMQYFVWIKAQEQHLESTLNDESVQEPHHFH